ncbi:MAG: DUF3299 domain-containing protein [Lewinellaceae bacterium]|nr:DUF3299 domain-containing protein [Lewinellaceae bacterium]MCB9295710.1 DUF3299 domain-containing protein [Lewinellaceae bacterium]
MPKHYWLTILIVLIALPLSAQEKIDWELLAKVRFKTEYIEDLGAYYLKPKFSGAVASLEGREVILSGYFIPFNEQQMFFVLSRYPFSSCYFCGAAGPESVVELQLKLEALRKFRMDERLTFKGTLLLNANDLDHCNYILKNAEPYEP